MFWYNLLGCCKFFCIFFGLVFIFGGNNLFFFLVFIGDIFFLGGVGLGLELDLDLFSFLLLFMVL